jgi:hypothetical protein
MRCACLVPYAGGDSAQDEESWLVRSPNGRHKIYVYDVKIKSIYLCFVTEFELCFRAMILDRAQQGRANRAKISIRFLVDEDAEGAKISRRGHAAAGRSRAVMLERVLQVAMREIAPLTTILDHALR